MITYYDTDQNIICSEVIKMTSQECPPDFDYDEWVKYIRERGQIILQVKCLDGITMIVRLNK